MKYEEYIKKLNTEDDSFEVGMLSELKQKPPVNLHSEIMKSVNKERKRPVYLNYKLYAPLVAAALVLAVVINNHEIVKGTNFLKIFEGHNDKMIATTITTENNGESGDMLSGAAGSNQDTFSATKEQTTAATYTASPTTAATSDSKPAVTKDSKPVQSADKAVSTKTTDKSGSSDTKVPGSDLSNLSGIVAVRYETINYEIMLETSQSSIISFLTNKTNCRQIDPENPSIYMMTGSKFSTFNDLLTENHINKILLNKVTEDNVVVKLIAENYQIIADANINDTVELIKDHSGKYVKNNMYEMSKKNYDSLINSMPKGVYTLKMVNAIFNDNVVLKIIPVNYELNLNGASDAITNYIANTDNAQPLSDNVYSFSKDSFAAFEKLLSDAGITIAKINEASGDNIIVKTNKN